MDPKNVPKLSRQRHRERQPENTSYDPRYQGFHINEAVEMESYAVSQDLAEVENRLLRGIRTVEPQAAECIPNTRTRILAAVVNESNDRHGANVIWIRGAPGSGKSSISITATTELRRQGQLVAYFRFDRNDAATTTTTALWRHVAYHLARRFPSVRQEILHQLRDDKLDLRSPIAVFTALVEQPLSILTYSPVDLPIVIVIDALDECGGFASYLSPDRQALLQTLARWPQLPKHFKLLVTSRKEDYIRRVLSSISARIDVPSGNVITDNPKSQASIDASEDIRIFLKGRFRQVALRFPSLCWDWPRTKMIAKMVHYAAGNFMWATTAANFIESGHPEDRLKRLMGRAPESMGMKPLYSLYSTLLDTSFGNFADDSSEAEVLRVVLGTIVLAQRPLHDHEYTNLPTDKPVDLTMIELIRDCLNSVVDQGPTLRFVHKSFDDFLLSKECPSKYRISPEESQRLLTQLCVTTMTAGLRFNICGLETSCLKNVDVPDIETRIAGGIPPLLSYSCCFWAEHLHLTPFDEQLMGEVVKMISTKLLYWFEAMSLLKEINRVSPSLLLLLKWSHSSPNDEFKEFVYDARRFIGTFGQPIAHSAPHIYVSALAFVPEHSFVARHFLPLFTQILVPSTGRPTDWLPCVFTSDHHQKRISHVAFSPDEKYFASGSGSRSEGNLCICDSETGNLMLGPFTVNSRVERVFFDPDGRYVWVGCAGGRVVGWDMAGGDQHLEFQGGKLIGCYCSNGQSIVTCLEGSVTFRNAETGERLRNLHIDDSNIHLVSCSTSGCYMACATRGNTSIRIWSLVDGSEITGRGRSHLNHESKHTRPVSSLSFSVDDDFAVSGSQDGTILVWNATTGDVISCPLATGDAEVNAVAYSPKSNLVVSGSGYPGTVMVWDASTHDAVLGPLTGHTSQITAIVLSRDGRKALTASNGGTVRMWDLCRKGVISETDTNQGHGGRIECVVFSPCGRKLVSLGVDKTIRVWDASHGKPVLSPIDTISNYDRITFSPDGRWIIAHGSACDTVRVWDASTGEFAFSQHLDSDAGIHSCRVTAYRSTDQQLITCFTDGMVRIWRLEDGVMTHHEDLCGSSPCTTPLTARRRNLIYIKAFSPDGLTAIVYDGNTYPRHQRHYLWNTTTYQSFSFASTDKEHISDNPVAYSPSGRFFATASSSIDNLTTLRVWDLQTRELVARSQTFSGWVGHLAFSPDDRHIAFSCRWTAIWIWDIHTGSLAPGPWNGHDSTISTLAFSPDGEKLASSTWSGQIRLWNTADLLGETQLSPGFLETGTRMEDGWVMDEDGHLLFWVPKDHRPRLIWPGAVTTIGGSGITTELDLSRLRYGSNWAECFEGGN